jgi:hypothetical protein
MAEQKKGMSKGCLIALIVVAIIAVVVVAIAIVGYVYKDEIVEMGLNKLTETVAVEIKNNLPEGVTAEDVDNLLAEFKQAYADAKIDQEEIQRLSVLLRESFEDKKIDQDEAKRFMEEIRKSIDE